jgi:hypothetical protein
MKKNQACTMNMVEYVDAKEEQWERHKMAKNTNNDQHKFSKQAKNK